MKKKSFIKTKVTGFAVVETIDFEMQLNAEDQAQFDENPEAVVTRLLKESGQEVNGMMITKQFIERHSGKSTKARRQGGRRGVRGHYHLVYPRNEKSGWICA